MRRTSWFALAAALLAGLVWILLPQPPATDHGAPGATAVPAPDPTAAAGSAAATKAPAAAQRTAVDADGPGSAAAPQVTVEVRDAATALPVAGAEVFAIEDPDQPQLPDLQQPGWHEPLPPQGSPLATTGTDGRCALPLPEARSGSVCARAGERRGERHVRWFAVAPGAVLRIDIATATAVRVQVTDAGGRPQADVPVALGLQFARDGQPIDYRVLAGRTGADGLLVVPRPAQLFDRSLLGGATSMQALACLAEPGLHTVAAPFAWQAPPAQPLRLVLPATGSLRLLLPEGLAGVPFRVQLEQLQPQRQLFPFQAAWLAGADTLDFPRAAVGSVFTAHAVAGSVILDSEPGGPRQAGECAELRFAQDQLLRLRGRAVQRGAAAAGRRLRFHLRGDSLDVELQGRVVQRGDHRGELVTAADGRFCVPLLRRWAGRPVQQFTLAAADRSPLRPETAAQGPFALPAGGEVDLGDCELAIAEPVAEGRVVLAGAPCTSFHCTARAADADAQPPAGAALQVARDGDRFAVFAEPPLGRGMLQVSARGAITAEVAFTAPAPDLLVELQPGGGLLASVHTGPGWPAAAVAGQLLPAAGGEPVPLRAQPDDDAGGMRLWRDDLGPGHYELRFGLTAQPSSWQQLAGIDVPPGGFAADPRLAGLHLSGAIVTVTCVDAASGERVREPGRLLLERPAVGSWRGVDLGRGPITLVVQGAPEALVLLPGYRPAEVQLVPPAVQVPLQRAAAALTARLAPPALPLPAGLALRLAAEPELAADELQPFATPKAHGRIADVLGRERQERALVPGTALRLPLLHGRWRLQLTAALGDRRTAVAVAPTALPLDGDREVELLVDDAEWQRVLRTLQ